MAKVKRMDDAALDEKLKADGIEDRLIDLALAVKNRAEAEERLKAWKAEHVDQYVEMERAMRESLQEYMFANDIKTLGNTMVTLTVVERHDYQIEDEDRFKTGLTMHGMTQDQFRIWDMPGIKKMASAFRKDNGEDFPGIESVPARFTQARLK